jgi:hypothetical protein
LSTENKRADSFAVASEHWKNMPEYVSEDLTPYRTLPVHFATEADMLAFSALVGQKITKITKSIWYPEAEIGRTADKKYVDEDTSEGF